MTWRLVELCRQRGVDPERACVTAGVSLSLVSDPSARVPYGSADRLLEAVADAVGRERLAVDLLTVVDTETYDAAGLLLLTGRTFLDGLARAFAFQRLWGDGERFRLSTTSTEATVAFAHPGSSSLANAVCAELAFLETVLAARLLVAPDATPLRVTFAQDAPVSNAAALHGGLGREASYGGATNALVFDRAALEKELAPPMAWIQRALEGQAARALAQLPARASLSSRIEALAGKGPEWFELRLEQAKIQADIDRRRAKVKPKCPPDQPLC